MCAIKYFGHRQLVVSTPKLSSQYYHLLGQILLGSLLDICDFHNSQPF